ncbi:SIMPL domain-containing protein [Pontibacter sp. Tf4]|uniref:SIMPL domain-containing protein n=1 Tax=Pontibacter sp. Tf4 TaxID=2761620 RepID=UPI00162618DE|nr:SIMPL domain-containing protein [Pontibacter sp. Tf4]MBB6611578.1 SIMPL domain-containing protein [Pontibacter sp. Tf4]
MRNYTSAILFSVAIIISAIVLGNAYIKRSKPEGEIAVTGNGSRDFTSDLIVWEGSFIKQGQDLKTASAQLEQDKQIIAGYLTKNGINPSEVVFSAIEITEQQRPKYSDKGQYMGDEFIGYRLTQSIQITSKEIEKIEDISRRITELLNEGIQLNSQPPRYYYTKLSDLKIELISEATKDARERAEKISQNSGSEIGDLISASLGIFQITGQNSNEEYSWGGTFNTSSKEKTASITVKLNYRVK